MNIRYESDTSSYASLGIFSLQELRGPVNTIECLSTDSLIMAHPSCYHKREGGPQPCSGPDQKDGHKVSRTFQSENLSPYCTTTTSTTLYKIYKPCISAYKIINNGRIWVLKLSKDCSDLFDMIGSFVSGATASLVAKNGNKKLF